MHIYIITKILYMFIFLGAFKVLKILYDYRHALYVAAMQYDFSNMIQSLIYSVIILCFSYRLLFKLP